MDEIIPQNDTSMSNSIAKLSEALSKAQGQFEHAKKGVENTFFKSKYADLASVIDAARDPLSKNGLAVIQLPKVLSDGKVLLVTMLTHSSGEWVRSEYPISPVKQDPQNMGSALTYARRYAFSAITGIASDDDDGNAASGNNSRETATSMKKRFNVVLKAIQESTDPTQTFKDNLAEIKGFELQDPAFYDELVKAGAKRKAELEQDAMMKQQLGE